MLSAGSLWKTLGVWISVATAEHSFFSSLFPLFLSRNHLPKGSICLSVSCVKKLSGALNFSFILIAFAQYQVMMEGKNKDFPWIESLRKNHWYFPYNEQIVVPQLTWHVASDCRMALDGGCSGHRGSPVGCVFYISLMLSNACGVLSQRNTQLRLIYLLIKTWKWTL